MSAPDTNIDKQAKRHKGPLGGIMAVLAFAAVLLIGFVVWTVYLGGDPEGAPVQVDGRTGEEVPGTADTLPAE